jgi:hypothetical protein
MVMALAAGCAASLVPSAARANGVAPAPAGPGWRIVATIGGPAKPESAGLLTAVSARDAFLSWRCAACARSTRDLNFISHWNGASWRQSIAQPARLNYPSFLIAIGASSASNLWAFTTTARASQWNGRRWATKRLPSWVLRPTRVGEPFGQAAVFSPRDVWVFSISAISAPALAAHLVGATWRKVILPGAPVQVSAVGSNDIWVLGLTNLSTTPTWALMHWNGSRWSTTPLPNVHVPNGDQAGYSIAATQQGVWVAREVSALRRTFSRALLHWTGHWQVISAPTSIDSFGALSQDGHGGLWAVGYQGFLSASQPFFYHYNGGRWSHQAVPARRGAKTAVDSMAWIPGTRSVWVAATSIAPKSESGLILKFGP